MKIKLTKAQIDKILANPEKAHEAGIKTNDPGASGRVPAQH